MLSAKRSLITASLCLALLVCFTLRSDAASLTLAWDPSDGAAGYILFWGTSSGAYSAQRDLGAVTQGAVSGLADGTTYFFAVKAYSSSGVVGGLSTEVSGTTAALSGTTTTTGGTSTAAISAPYLGFGGDGKASLLLQSDGGSLQAWFLSGGTTARAQNLSPAEADPAWHIVGSADFNNDGWPDLLFQHATSGGLVLWYMNGTVRLSAVSPTPVAPPETNWNVVGVGDFNADGRPDILFQHRTYGILLTWFMEGRVMKSTSYTVPSGPRDAAWKVVGVADMNTDRQPDIVFQHGATGAINVWFMNGTTMSGSAKPTPSAADVRWLCVGVADVNGDGIQDIVFQHGQTGAALVWFMRAGLKRSSAQDVSPIPSSGWRIAASQ